MDNNWKYEWFWALCFSLWVVTLLAVWVMIIRVYNFTALVQDDFNRQHASQVERQGNK